MSTTKKRTKRKPKQTLAEFRAWLCGVEELQEAEWSPTRDQWVLIRDRIDKIIEPEPEIVYEHVVAPAPQAGVYNPHGIPPLPAPVNNIPAPTHVEAGSSLQQPTTPQDTSTPNIDTRDGNYASGFV